MRVSSSRGGSVELPFEEFVHRRDAEVTRRLRLFPGRGFDGVFASAPVRGVVDKDVRAVSSGERARFRVELDFNSSLTDYSPGSVSVPAFVTGRLSGAHGGEPVAIAVNGRVAAVTRSYRDGADVRLDAMISPRVLRRGSNRIEALAVTGSGPGVRLAPAGGTAQRGAQLVSEGGRLVLVMAGKRRVPLRSGAADGRLNLSSVEDGAEITGWATDARHRRAAERVMLFEDGRLVAATAPSLVRANVVRRYRSFGVARSGFRFAGVAGLREAVRSGELVVVAVSGEGASKLRPAR